MVAKEISSLQHPLVKRAVQLRLEKSAREENKQVLVAGRKLISDLAPSWPLEILFFTDSPPPLPAKELIKVTPEILKKICGVEEAAGWAAIVPLPPPQPLSQKNYILILDQVRDPGNLGTLWRTALGLGWDGIWLTPGCVDPFNDKALRSAKGATFRLPYEKISPEEISNWLKSRSAKLFTADLDGAPLSKCGAHPPLALLLGNEGSGPSPWTASLSSKVTIPMNPSIESLNVASAGAILLYAMRGELK